MSQDIRMLANELDARKVADHGRTIAVLTDERPGLDVQSARELIAFLRGCGYAVHEMTVEEFKSRDMTRIGFMLVIPHAESAPVEMADALEHYWKHGGHVLVLGGPLFGKLIQKEEGRYVEIPLRMDTLDAVHYVNSEFTMEGVAPTHKVYFEKDAPGFLTESDQSVTQARLKSDRPETVLCGIARPHGIGFGMEHRNRMITLVQAKGEGGRAQGRRGAAAYMVLSNTRGHLRRTNGTRPGSVSATTPGSCVAVVGLTRQDILKVEGMDALLRDMVDAMCRGIYLYEGGCETFAAKKGETLRLGARVLSIAQDFLPAEVRFTLRSADGKQTVLSRELLVCARAYSEVTADWVCDSNGDVSVATELVMDGRVIDRIEQELLISTKPAGNGPDDYIRAEGDGFVLNGKPWYAYGMNYWPLFYPSFDRPDYWMGWMDKANYDPLETERDLAQMEDMKINLVCTRLDGDVFGRSMDSLKDFIERCRRHNMKLMLSYVNVTNPLFYQKLASEKLLKETGLADDPMLFCHDISWETGPQLLGYVEQFDGGWEKWIIDHYGSVENAEKDWGVPVDRDESGRPVCPPKAQFSENGPWRIKVSACRRYLDNVVSRKWNDAMQHLRSLDPNHLISYRGGVYPKSAPFYLTGTVKHVDFMALEGYSFEQNEEGLGGMICVSRLARLLSGGKPVTWVEYGLSLIGTSGNSPWNALRWDKANLAPYPDMLEQQRIYNEMFFKAFKEADVVGSAPWWYPGGFRRVELSDCGYVARNGVPRPVWDQYLKEAEWFFEPREKREPDEIVVFDPDSTAQGWGHCYLGSGMVDRNDRDMARVNGRPVDENPEWGEGAVACREAMKAGRKVDFTTPGFGTTSADMPMLAIGNTPLNGTNPPKYLDAEFNSIVLTVGGEKILVCDGDTVCVSAGQKVSIEASVGNLREARWVKLGGTAKGSVGLGVFVDGQNIFLPIAEDTPYLSDAAVVGVLPEICSETAEVVLRMEAAGISAFGETMRFMLKRKPE